MASSIGKTRFEINGVNMTPAFDKLAEIQRELFVQHQQSNLFDRMEEDD